MSGPNHRTPTDDRLEKFFLAAHIGSIVSVLSYSVFFLGYLLTHEELTAAIFDALYSFDFIAMQHAIEAVALGVLQVTGWIRLALGLGLVLMSFFFILNTAGIIFSVFIRKSFSAGGEPTVSWYRMSVSRLYLTIKLLFFVALYRISGYQGFSILQEFFPNNIILSAGFFLSSATSFGTMIVLISVIKVVVYETRKYEYMIEENRARVSQTLRKYLVMWSNNVAILKDALKAKSLPYSVAKLEIAIPELETQIKLIDEAISDLKRMSTPNKIIKKVMFAFIGVVIMQVITDVVLNLGWGVILDFIFGWLGG